MSEKSLGENPSANSVDWGAVKIRERKRSSGGKCQEIPVDDVPTPPEILSTFQLLNFSTSLLRLLQGLLNSFYVVHTPYTQWCYQVIWHPHQSHLFTKLKLDSGPSIYCRSLILGNWRPVTLGAHKNPRLDFPLYILNLLSEGFGDKGYHIRPELSRDPKGLRFII
jgi:hypothetical protein